MNLFETSLDPKLKPLAERLRPKTFEEILGQTQIFDTRNSIGKLLKSGTLLNLILTGPPGSGKTSFAHALAKSAKAHFINLNAVDAGVKELKSAAETGKQKLYQYNEKTILFVDEIHRFNKSQQDVLLPYVERGELYLVGATTENPSYELNRALLSRCHVIQFNRLEKSDFTKLFFKAIRDFQVTRNEPPLNEFSLSESSLSEVELLFNEKAFDQLISFSDGDARRFLNYIEFILNLYSIDKSEFPLSIEALQKLLGSRVIGYDKKSDQHYDCISAFIKSIRGSDADAALYYMARMLKGGEDPVFIARRLVILASEDVGNAEPRALPLAIAGLQAVETIGMPECAISLSQVVTFLASCPKSNRSYQAWNKAKEYVEHSGTLDIPDHIKSSQKNSGEYLYPHDFEKGFIKQNYWPKNVSPQKFYEPSTHGNEKHILEYLKWLKS